MNHIKNNSWIKKIIAIAAVFAMIVTMIPAMGNVYAGEAGTHTVAFYMPDDAGKPQEEAYFTIQVTDGQSIGDAMEAQEHYLNWPAKFGYEFGWKLGTVNSGGFIDYDMERGYEDSVAITGDINYYGCWEEIVIDNLEYGFNIRNSEHVSVWNESRRMLEEYANSILHDIRYYGSEGYEPDSNISEDFISGIKESLDAERQVDLDMDFGISEHYSDQDELTGIEFSFILSYKDKDGAEGNEYVRKFRDNIAVVVCIEDAEGEYSLRECNNEENFEINMFDEEYGGFLFWNVRTAGMYEFAFTGNGGEGDGDGDGASYVPQNQIIVEYWFYTRSGQYNFFPISIVLDDANSNEKLQDLVTEYGKTLAGSHYKDSDLVFDTWEIGGPEGSAPAGDFGGSTINANALYKNGAVAVQTTLSYYDKNCEKCNDDMVVVIKNAGSKTTKAVYDALDADGTLDAISHYGGKDAVREWRFPVRGLLENGYYIEPLELKAAYDKQPVQITCTYNYGGNTVTVSGKVIVDKKKGMDIYKAFEAFLKEHKVPVGSIKGWAIDPWSGFDAEGDELNVAAIYAGSTPAYIDRAYMKCDSVDGAYYFVSSSAGDSEIVYINEAYPTVLDEPFDDTYSKKVKAAATDKFGKDPSAALKFKEFSIDWASVANVMEGEDVVVKTTDKYEYRHGVFYTMNAVYKGASGESVVAVVEVVDADGTTTQHLYPLDSEAPFVIGTEGSGELWDMETARAGGTSYPGGTAVEVEAPYTKLSVWTLSKYTLEMVPKALKNDFSTVDKLQTAMDKKMLDVKSSWDADEMQVEYYEVGLMKNTEEGRIQVTNKNFPKKGIWVMFDYPEGTDKTTDFAIAHMFTEKADGHEAGDIEIITEKTRGKDGKPRLVKADRGIKVLMYSLSPISVAYGDGVEAGDAQAGTNAPAGGNDDSDEAATDKVTKTGDDFNMTLPIALAGLALAVMAVALFRRRKA